MQIKKATLKDSESIALLFMLVMDHMVYRFIGEKDFQKGINFFANFIGQTNNQYSYQNCYVAIEGDKMVGVINIYDGALLDELRQPILDYIHHHNNSKFTIENETQSGEFYIDVLAVNPLHQGKGIGSQLLAHTIQEFGVKLKRTLGLLVDKKNPNAKKLYLQVGFEKVGEKILSGHDMEHLQLKI
jgi:ribosomal protein S18 acetylase RimI-like enzyme